MSEIFRETPPFRSVVESYLEIDGIDAAGLISGDGLLVTWAGDRRLDGEAIAAHAATYLSSLAALANELDSSVPRLVDVGLPGRDMLLAPLTGDLSLVLIGRESAFSALAGGRLSAGRIVL